MGKNKIVVALVVFVALLALALLLRKDPYETPKEKSALPVLPQLDAAKVDKVELVKKDETLVFEKKGDRWWITSPKAFQADKNFATLVVDKFVKVELSRLVSQKKENLKSFELDEEGVRVKFYQEGKETLALVVGKNTQDFQGTFVRTLDSDDIYATGKVIAGALKRSLNDWRDKFIFGDIETTTVKTIAFAKGKSAYAFEQNVGTPADQVKEGETPTPAGWRLVGDDKFYLDQQRLNSTLSTLLKLQWAEVEDEPKEAAAYGLDKPEAEIKFTQTNGEGKGLKVGPLDAEKKTAWVQVEGDPKVYQIRQYQYDRLVKDLEFYRGDNKEAPPPVPMPANIPIK
ncbi:MAG: DUF4340 domain-containing protein [Myxococcales bacterium]|nr:MAG: DUF4340 domain-containing protein [Myxococcales bacterium]